MPEVAARMPANKKNTKETRLDRENFMFTLNRWLGVISRDVRMK